MVKVEDKMKQKVNKKEKLKGILIIGLGIVGLVIFAAVSFKGTKLSGGFFIVLGSIGLIWEGLRIKNGKKSIFFNITNNS